MSTNAWEALPSTFLERLEQIVPSDQRTAVLATFTVEKPVTFRTNTLKITSAELKKKLTKHGILFHQVDWYNDAFILDRSQHKSVLVDSTLHQQGLLYIQSLSSMIPPLVLAPQPKEAVCDLTAAPGSKTTQMSMMMQNTGTILANDISRTRMFRLKATLEMQNVTNTETSLIPGQALWKRYPEQFDKVLVDVPCTLEGRFSALDPQTYKEWTPRKAKLLSQLQKFLLRSAVSLTKPGGTIVYSTCTYEPEENEGVIDWILQKEGSVISVEDISLPIGELLPGLTQWNKKKFDKSLNKTVRVLPSESMEGFYVAKIKKLTSSLPPLLA